MAQHIGYLEVPGGKRLVVATGTAAFEDDEVETTITVPFTRLLGGTVSATADADGEAPFIPDEEFGDNPDRRIDVKRAAGTTSGLGFSYILVGN
jgi:hypothetical protein